ncbi:MAG TPA: prolipoprotein diacylglyceryl transferase [Solirubrobacterales bacterium]|nr:prolipoprotein diacylglyceryl transferase [Solirubrobacterales bacterium]
MSAAIPSPSVNDFHVGPVEFHLYGIIYAIAIAVAGMIVVRRWEARGGSRELVFDVLLWSIPAGVIGGRIYFDLTSSGEVPPHWWGPFAVWDGGLGSWGAFSAGVLVAVWRVRRAGASVAQALDAAAPAFLVAMAIGRVANYVNQELFGEPTSLPWGVEIDPSHRPAGYHQYTTFQPTYFYEAVWDLSLAAFLVWLDNHRQIRPPGLFALFVTGYSGFRIFEELLRVDPSHHILSLRLNFFVACLVTIAGALWFAWTQERWGRRPPASAPGPP